MNSWNAIVQWWEEQELPAMNTEKNEKYENHDNLKSGNVRKQLLLSTTFHKKLVYAPYSKYKSGWAEKMAIRGKNTITSNIIFIL